MGGGGMKLPVGGGGRGGIDGGRGLDSKGEARPRARPRRGPKGWRGQKSPQPEAVGPPGGVQTAGERRARARTLRVGVRQSSPSRREVELVEVPTFSDGEKHAVWLAEHRDCIHGEGVAGGGEDILQQEGQGRKKKREKKVKIFILRPFGPALVSHPLQCLRGRYLKGAGLQYNSVGHIMSAGWKKREREDTAQTRGFSKSLRGLKKARHKDCFPQTLTFEETQTHASMCEPVMSVATAWLGERGTR